MQENALGISGKEVLQIGKRFLVLRDRGSLRGSYFMAIQRFMADPGNGIGFAGLRSGYIWRNPSHKE
ncbi:MAG: hypothetical protein CO189_11550 [candidate division Zixibacteria bacterium CG_4_9_14_3_um_filter_46_8]|nr:MAG: hypothetical protein CO189_11550 [candidate division Zixibacteria bacterium CG_4_9_14_3_um_filter_46_8]